MHEFEQRRNEPEQYNRDLYVKTVQAMERIKDIKKRREDRFWENRMRLARVQKQSDIENEVVKHASLLKEKEANEEMLLRLRESEKERR